MVIILGQGNYVDNIKCAWHRRQIIKNAYLAGIRIVMHKKCFVNFT